MTKNRTGTARFLVLATIVAQVLMTSIMAPALAVIPSYLQIKSAQY